MPNQIINFTSNLLPDIRLEPGNSFFWSPKHNKITYNESVITSPIGTWSMLHEVAHALMRHTNYASDLELLRLEVEAWDEAKKLGDKLGLIINDDHIQDCLDTYRDWLHRRSTCPNCGIVCLQSTSTLYHCHNCNISWNVSASRFCRPYRLQINSKKEEKPQVLTATFL
ncbi:MAG TPA: hypothetical protein VMV24_00650 [Candidatus Dormibacteraeota bacterium]|nr:hypothetical protein [Candidatus Dormibacteraeota bacterium]